MYNPNLEYTWIIFKPAVKCVVIYLVYSENSGAGSAYPFGAPEFTPVFVGFSLLNPWLSVLCFVDHCSRILTFMSFCSFLMPIELHGL